MKYFCLLIFILLGCSGAKVISIVGERANFQNYYTFKIQHPDYPDNADIVTKATIMQAKIENAITIELTARGYTKAEPADIKVSYKLILDNKVDYESNNYRSTNRINPYADPYRYPYNQYNNMGTQYTEGTLIVEIREDYENKAVWDGSLDLKYNQSKKSKHDPITNAFHLIFAEYHYIAGKKEPVIQSE